MKCEWVQENILLYVYNELADDARYELEQHVARCADCAAELKASRKFNAVISQFPVEEPPQGAVRLAKAHVRVLTDGPGLWTATGGIDVTDFIYESVEAQPGVTVKDRLRWLRTVQPDFAPGPYDHLVNVYGFDRPTASSAISRASSAICRSWR